jgi:hypothetical protein
MGMFCGVSLGYQRRGFSAETQSVYADSARIARLTRFAAVPGSAATIPLIVLSSSGKDH